MGKYPWFSSSSVYVRVILNLCFIAIALSCYVLENVPLFYLLLNCISVYLVYLAGCTPGQIVR